jgi:hypothetical protein
LRRHLAEYVAAAVDACEYATTSGGGIAALGPTAWRRAAAADGTSGTTTATAHPKDKTAKQGGTASSTESRSSSSSNPATRAITCWADVEAHSGLWRSGMCIKPIAALLERRQSSDKDNDGPAATTSTATIALDTVEGAALKLHLVAAAADVVERAAVLRRSEALVALSQQAPWRKVADAA